MKRLKRRLLGRAPGNPLARFLELSKAAEPPLLLVLGPLSLDSMLLLGPTADDSIGRTLHVNCSVKLPDYSWIMLYAFADRLFRKLCQHIRRISKDCAPGFSYCKWWTDILEMRLCLELSEMLLLKCNKVIKTWVCCTVAPSFFVSSDQFCQSVPPQTTTRASWKSYLHWHWLHCPRCSYYCLLLQIVSWLSQVEWTLY